MSLRGCCPKCNYNSWIYNGLNKKLQCIVCKNEVRDILKKTSRNKKTIILNFQPIF